MAGFDRKRAKVTGNGGKGRAGRTLLIVLACAALFAGAILMLKLRTAPTSGTDAKGSSGSAAIQMTDITASVKNGKIAVSLAAVKEKGLVRFVYKGSKDIPLLAYITPAGKVVTAVSMCEPCSSSRFFIQGKKIICSTCYTQWDLETLKGIQGGCTAYPPDRLTSTVDGDNILIDEAVVAKWQPRI